MGEGSELNTMLQTPVEKEIIDLSGVGGNDQSPWGVLLGEKVGMGGEGTYVPPTFGSTGPFEKRYSKG